MRLTSRAAAPNREVIAFGAGLSPVRSSAPLTFARATKRTRRFASTTSHIAAASKYSPTGEAP